MFHVSTEKNLGIDHPVRRFLDPHLHPSGLIDNIAAVISPNGYLPFKDPLPERVVRYIFCMKGQQRRIGFIGGKKPLRHYPVFPAIMYLTQPAI